MHPRWGQSTNVGGGDHLEHHARTAPRRNGRYQFVVLSDAAAKKKEWKGFARQNARWWEAARSAFGPTLWHPVITRRNGAREGAQRQNLCASARGSAPNEVPLLLKQDPAAHRTG